MKVFQEKLEFLLDKYSVETKAVLKDCKTKVRIHRFFLTEWREDLLSLKTLCRAEHL